MDKETQENVFVGVPPTVLLPARDFKFKVVQEDVSIVVSRRGLYSDIAPDFFTEGDGRFDILSLDDESGDFVLYLPSITKVLFAEHKYPDLKPSQLFTIIALIFNEDSVEVVGNIIEMLLVE